MSTTLLDRLIEPFAECLTPESAHKIVSLKADAELQARVDVLAEKANQGALSGDEEMEYDRYLAAYHFVTAVQARARRLLHS
jgi:hypothetical protein